VSKIIQSNLPDERVELTAYSSYRGEQSPRVFILHGKKIEVIGIVNMWIEEGIEDKTRKRLFKVKGSDGHMHKIYYAENTMEWFYTRER